MTKKRLRPRRAFLSFLIVSVLLSTLFSGMQVFAYDTGATVTASYTFFMDATSEVNDGIVSYDDTPSNRWTSYESPNATDWVQTDFGSAVTRSSAEVYLYDDGGGVKAPSSYKVQYLNGSTWTDAAGQVKSPASPTGNQVNTVAFTSVSASKFRIVFTHQSGSKSGVTEIAYGTGSSTPPTDPPTTPPSSPLAGTSTASYTFHMDEVDDVDDGTISYVNSPHNRWTSYQSPNATDWVQKDLSASSTVSQAEIYIYDDGGGVKAPASYNVQYWNGTAWTNAASQSKSPAAPTGGQVNTVTFTAVTTSKMRIVFTPQSGSASGATEIKYYGTGGGTTPPTEPPTGEYPNYQVSVVSPSYGASINGTITIKFYAPGMQNVWARSWHQPDTAHPNANGYDSWFQRVTPAANGYGEVTFPAADFPHGPITVILSAWDSPEGNPNYAHSDNCYVQLYNEGGVTWKQGIPSAPSQASGMSVLFQDDFTGPLSASRTGAGATYATSKPDAPNGTEFGEAIFADYGSANDPFAILGSNYLRIRAKKAPSGTVDPMGWNRTYTGGLLSSVRTNGTGVAATYGYFEARILMPAGKGTWPAFWLMSQNSISQGVPSTAEIDTVEAYGQDPNGACQAKHWWAGNPEMHDTHCSSSNFAFGDNASTWHIYGTKITPTDTIYYIDNVEVWRHTTFDQAKTPMYFMINLALGGGWPIDLARYNNQVDMFVDYVRVFQ
ncbi:discoidin domain-containing protein [Paenibacillus lignilyticus]|uniref:Family 16 glycosylhydrolase n=1 Tax=Paenibacillus lignilyticus TaxID=1172615 RepID=A0ABS5CKV9_9BACL|nr:discoidin domain-containing protein [Paenibacillus lignilyticus]MBP3966499.1 family 16 glycosylhydrolase [Paenibacillus lignilyticus]